MFSTWAGNVSPLLVASEVSNGDDIFRKDRTTRHQIPLGRFWQTGHCRANWDSPTCYLTKFPPTNGSPPLGLLALDPAINLSNLCSAVIELSPDPKSLLLPLGGLIRSYIPVAFLTSCESWPTASYCRRSFRLWVNQCSNQVPWQWCAAYIRWPSFCYVLWVC